MTLYTKKNARRSIFDTVTYRVVSQVTTILGYIVLVRGMSRHDFGVLNLLYAFLPVASTVASFGLEQTLRRFQPEYLKAGNAPAAHWLMRFVSSARFGTNTMLLTAVLLAWNVVAPIFKLGAYRPEFMLFCFLVFLHFQSRIQQISLASHMLHRFSVGSGAIISAGKLVTYVVLIYFDRLTLQNAIIADTLAYGIAYGFLSLMYRRHCNTPPAAKFRPDAPERRRLFRYGLFNNFNDAGTLVLNVRSDNFFIAALIDPIAVATYAFYTRLREMTTNLLPVNLFENIVQPMFFSIAAGEAEKRIPRYFSLLLNLNLLVQFPILAYITSFHAEIVTVFFGGKYVEYSWMLPLVTAFATLNVVATPVTLVAQYGERVSILLWSKVFAVYNVVAMLVLVPISGLYGAAIATGTAQLLKNLFVWFGVRKLAHWTNCIGVVTTALLVWGGAVGACYALKLLGLHPIVDLICGLGICCLAMLIYLRSPALSPSDREILGAVLRGREVRLLKLLGVLSRDRRGDERG